ncbi:alginate lyase family protein [Paenibacillus foliorum]|uniref:alginate lyase family protein n=1 Tax=Paenibacillus foliorum TaxID=2654974 RepID=UPI00149238AF|nr:alginate lyase family protein [Paenibacillus foliorum]
MNHLRRLKSKISGLLSILLVLSVLGQAGGLLVPIANGASDNLVLGSTLVGYSTQATAGVASSVYDGLISTYWQPNSSERDPAKTGAWVSINLGAVKSFNKAVFQMAVSNGVSKVRIEYSNNNSSWTKAYEETVTNRGTTARTETVKLNNTVTAQYVRITFLFSAQSPNFQLSEFELYNDGGPTEPAPVTSAFISSANGTATILWTDPVQSAVYLDFDKVKVFDLSDGSKSVLVNKGQQSATFTNLNVNKAYTFAIQTVTTDDKISSNVLVSVKPDIYPNTQLFNSGQLRAVKNKILTPGNTDYSGAVNQLIVDAELAMTNGPYSVMYKTGTPPNKTPSNPEGDKHDYWSAAPYWWPDPTKPDGLPYINRDGETNPEGLTDKYDKQSYTLLRTTVSILSLAYYYTNDNKYADRAALLLKTWFIDPETKMNPNMNYAQGVGGAENGRKEGVLESDKLLEIIDSIELISNSGSWSSSDTLSFKKWLMQYTEWLQASPLAQAEKATINNHGTWYDAQFVNYLMYLGKKEDAKAYLQKTAIPRISAQIMDDGTMPEELRRTRPFHYFLFNLIPFSMLSILGDQVGVDLWNSGDGIRKAYGFIAPYIIDFAQWPYDELRDEDETAFARYLREAAVRYGDDRLWSAAEIMLGEQLHTHRVNLIAPGNTDPAPRKELVAFSFQGLYVPVIGTINNDEITLDVPNGTDVTSLIATFKTSGQRVKIGSILQESGVTANDFTNPVVYSVESPSGSSRNYTIRVNVLPNRLPVTIYETGFSDYRNDPSIDKDLLVDSSKTIFDLIKPMPQALSEMKPLTWYSGLNDNGMVKSSARIFIKDGNSQHTRSMPAALRLVKDAVYGSTVTIPISLKNYNNISGSFAARTQDQSVTYNLYSEWSVDGGATWNVANTLTRDATRTTLTDSYGNYPFSFSINDVRANNNPNFLFRLRLDKSSSGYMNIDDFKLTGEPLFDLNQKELTEFSFKGLNPDVSGTIDGTEIRLTVPYGTNVTQLVASFNTSGTKVRVGSTTQVSGVTANSFTDPVVYIVEAGNGTRQNYTVKVNTTAEIDTTPPVWPGNAVLSYSNVNQTGMILSWPKATDNVGIKEYRVYNGDSLMGTVTGTTYSVSGLTARTNYTFKIVALDQAGNQRVGLSVAATTLGYSNSSSSSRPGAGSPSTENASNAEIGKIDSSSITVKEEKTVDGRTIQLVTVDVAGLSKAIEAIKGKNSNEQKITLEVKGSGSVVKVDLPGSAIQSGNQFAPQTVISIKTDMATYNLPIKVIDVGAIAKSLGADTKDVQIRVSIEKVAGAIGEQILQKANAAGLTLIGGDQAKVLDFKITAVAKGSVVSIDHFNNTYVSRIIVIPQKVDPAKATAVLYNPATGEMTFVPAVFNVVDGNTQVTIKNHSNSIYMVVQSSKSFADLNGHWAKADVELLASKLLVKGFTDTAFEPGNSITRAEFAALLVRALGLNADPSSKFSDVNSKDWFASAIVAAAQSGIVAGFEDGTFRPNAPITREQMALMITRSMTIAGKSNDTSGRVKQLLTKFADQGTISAWAQEAVAQAVDAALINGQTDTTFVPQANATRAEAAVMLRRFLQFEGFIN